MLCNVITYNNVNIRAILHKNIVRVLFNRHFLIRYVYYLEVRSNLKQYFRISKVLAINFFKLNFRLKINFHVIKFHMNVSVVEFSIDIYTRHPFILGGIRVIRSCGSPSSTHYISCLWSSLNINKMIGRRHLGVIVFSSIRLILSF